MVNTSASAGVCVDVAVGDRYRLAVEPEGGVAAHRGALHVRVDDDEGLDDAGKRVAEDHVRRLLERQPSRAALREHLQDLRGAVAAAVVGEHDLVRVRRLTADGRRARAGRDLALEEVDAEAVGDARVVEADDDEVLVLVGEWVAHPRVVLVGAKVEAALLLEAYAYHLRDVGAAVRRKNEGVGHLGLFFSLVCFHPKNAGKKKFSHPLF